MKNFFSLKTHKIAWKLYQMWDKDFNCLWVIYSIYLVFLVNSFIFLITQLSSTAINNKGLHLGITSVEELQQKKCSHEALECTQQPSVKRCYNNIHVPGLETTKWGDLWLTLEASQSYDSCCLRMQRSVFVRKTWKDSEVRWS